VQAPGRARLTGAAALALAAGLALPARGWWGPLALAGAGVLLTAVAAWTWPALGPGAVGALAAAYALALLGRPASLGPWAPAYGAGLLALAELIDLAREERLPLRTEPAARWGRLGGIAALALAGGAAGLLVLVPAWPRGGGAGRLTLGVAGAAALLGLVAAVARSAGRARRPAEETQPEDPLPRRSS
jgi:hypothetical protein